MNKKLVFLDIDGTLTDRGLSVPPESALQAIRQAQKNGHQIFLCTGRNYCLLKPLMAYGFDGAIGSAGGYVYLRDSESQNHEKVVYDHPMSNAVRDKVLRVMSEIDAYCVLESKDGEYASPGALKLMGDARQEPDDSEMARWKAAKEDHVTFKLLDEYDGSPVYKIMYLTQNVEGLSKAEKELGDQFFFCRLDGFCRDGIHHGELINRDFDKGTGIQKICEYLHMSLADTIGVGDSMNDKAMLETVGISVCMGNGAEEVKAISDVICPPVWDDGLARAFESLGLLKS